MAQAVRTSAHRRRSKATGQRITSGLTTHPRHFRGRQHAAAIITIVAVAVCAFRLFPNRDVTILRDGQTYQVAATFDPRAEALSSANVEPGDVVSFSEYNSHSSVAVQRAQPVQVTADGVVTSIRTQAATIEGALAEAGVPLQPGDRVYLDGRLTTARGPLAASVAASRQFILENPDRAGSRPPVDLAIVRARPITLVVDVLKVDSRSSAPTVQAFLAELGLTVREGDLVVPALDSDLSAGMTVRLKKGRTVTVAIDGKEQSVYTLAPTVGDLFRILNVPIGPEDVLSLAPDTVVTNGLTVNLGRTIEADEEVIEPISPPVQYEQDASMAAGTAKTIPGAAGEKKVTYHVTYKAGQVVERIPLPGGEIIVQPIPTRIIQGTKGKSPVAVVNPNPTTPPVSAATTGGNTSSGRTLTVWATWYNESHGGKDPGDYGYGITKSGLRLDHGICATDPSVIPLGTWFYVPGYGRCLAADIGGGVRGNHIDLGFPEAYGIPDWGERTVEITIFD